MKAVLPSEPLLRRAINAAMRVGGEKQLTDLIAFSRRADVSDALKAEAISTLGTWANPSFNDRVDGRYRGLIQRDPAVVKTKIQPLVTTFLQDKNDETVISAIGLISNLDINEANNQLVALYNSSENVKVKTAIITALNQLHYPQMDIFIKTAMEDKNENVRTTALGLLNDSNTSTETLPTIVANILKKAQQKKNSKF